MTLQGESTHSIYEIMRVKEIMDNLKKEKRVQLKFKK